MEAKSQIRGHPQSLFFRKEAAAAPYTVAGTLTLPYANFCGGIAANCCKKHHKKRTWFYISLLRQLLDPHFSCTCTCTCIYARNYPHPARFYFRPPPSPVCTAAFLAKQYSASPKCFLICISIKLRFVTDSPKRQYALLGCLQAIFGYNWKNIPFLGVGKARRLSYF